MVWYSKIRLQMLLLLWFHSLRVNDLKKYLSADHNFMKIDLEFIYTNLWKAFRAKLAYYHKDIHFWLELTRCNNHMFFKKYFCTFKPSDTTNNRVLSSDVIN